MEMWYLCTVEYYSAVKKKETVNLASKWMELESIELSKVTQAQKDKSCMFSISCKSWLWIFRCEYTIWSNHRNKEIKKWPWWGMREERIVERGDLRTHIVWRGKQEKWGGDFNWGGPENALLREREGGGINNTKDVLKSHRKLHYFMLKVTCRMLKFLYVFKALNVMLGKCFLAELHPPSPSTVLLFAMMYLFFVNLLIYCLCGT